MANKTIAALILAAGLSSRMEKFKPLLTIGGKALIEHVITLFNVSAISKIITVVGHRAEDVSPFLQASSTEWVINNQVNGDMFSSVQLGTEKLRNQCDAFFLLPVDIPLVRPATIRQLLDAYDANPGMSVYYPKYKSRRGHPPLIDSSLIVPVLNYNGADGMRGILRRHKGQALDVEVNDPFILMDADTPDDLLDLETAYLSLS